MSLTRSRSIRGVSRRHRAARLGRAAAAVGATAIAFGGLAGASVAAGTTPQDVSANYTFQTLNNNHDDTFNQLLGVNNSGVIAGYFGSGMAGHPNKGYVLNKPYGQGSYRN